VETECLVVFDDGVGAGGEIVFFWVGEGGGAAEFVVLEAEEARCSGDDAGVVYDAGGDVVFEGAESEVDVGGGHHGVAADEEGGFVVFGGVDDYGAVFGLLSGKDVDGAGEVFFKGLFVECGESGGVEFCVDVFAGFEFGECMGGKIGFVMEAEADEYEFVHGVFVGG